MKRSSSPLLNCLAAMMKVWAILCLIVFFATLATVSLILIVRGGIAISTYILP